MQTLSNEIGDSPRLNKDNIDSLALLPLVIY